MASNRIPHKVRRRPADRIEATDADGRPVAITLYEHPGRGIRWIEWTRTDPETGATILRFNQMYSGRRYEQAVTEFAEARRTFEEESASPVSTANRAP